MSFYNNAYLCTILYACLSYYRDICRIFRLVPTFNKRLTYFGLFALLSELIQLLLKSPSHPNTHNTLIIILLYLWFQRTTWGVVYVLFRSTSTWYTIFCCEGYQSRLGGIREKKNTYIPQSSSRHFSQFFKHLASIYDWRSVVWWRFCSVKEEIQSDDWIKIITNRTDMINLWSLQDSHNPSRL